MQLDVQGNGSKKVTVSIGVATFPQACQTAADLVRSAYRVLYLANNNGATVSRWRKPWLPVNGFRLR